MLVPAQLSLTANKGDTVELVTYIHKTERKEEITWKHNGTNMLFHSCRQKTLICGLHIVLWTITHYYCVHITYISWWLIKHCNILGNYYSTTHMEERVNNTARLTLNYVTEGHAGIYSANFIGESLLFGAIMRLIVRGM